MARRRAGRCRRARIGGGPEAWARVGTLTSPEPSSGADARARIRAVGRIRPESRRECSTRWAFGRRRRRRSRRRRSRARRGAGGARRRREDDGRLVVVIIGIGRGRAMIETRERDEGGIA